jgi:hypothetical protein
VDAVPVTGEVSFAVRGGRTVLDAEPSLSAGDTSIRTGSVGDGMREFDTAIGTVASCCSVLKDPYQAVWTRQGQRITIQHRGGVVTLIANPTEGAFQAYSVRKLTNIEWFDISQSEAVVDLETELSELSDELAPSNIKLTALTETEASTGEEYFAGFRAERPLFVYDDGFGPQQFDETLSELDQTCRIAVNEIVDTLDLDIEEIDDTAGEDEEAEEPESIAFQ